MKFVKEIYVLIVFKHRMKDKIHLNKAFCYIFNLLYI